MLEATYAGGERTVTCAKVREGNNGIFLIDETDSQIGYVPYDTLDWAVTNDEQSADDTQPATDTEFRR